MEAVLTIAGVRKAFPGAPGGPGLRVLECFDLQVFRGEVVSLVGPSGCGKSTLLNLATGLLPLDSGTVCLAPGARSAYMFQKEALFPWKTVLGNIEFPLTVKGMQRPDRQRRARAMLDLVGLGANANQYPGQLSQGMRKRVALAALLVHEPDVLFLDEPFSSVDFPTRVTLETELLRLVAAASIAVVLVTHDIYEAVSISDRVLTLSRPPMRIVDEARVAIPRPRDLFAVGGTEAFRKTWAAVGDRLRTEVLGGGQEP